MTDHEAPGEPAPAESDAEPSGQEPDRRASRWHRPSIRTVAAVGAVVIAAAALGVSLTRGSSSGTNSASPASQSAPLQILPSTTSEVQNTAQNTPLPSDATTAEQVYRTDAAGVVEITTSTGSGNESPFGGNSGNSGALGTGFVIDTDGHIVTNEHVIDGANSVTVKFADGKEVSARVVGSDASTDTALLQVDAPSELHPIALGNSDSLVVGQDVYAIGNPYGLDRTLTTGVVSALDRDIQAPNGYSISGAIQTDAAINSGNSGGPLLNAQGQVVGITAQIESQSGGNVGIGYAIPINLVKGVVSQLESSGSVQHAYLGVSVEALTPDLAQSLGLSDTRGAYVADVRPGSPAANAGLQGGENGGGDVIRAAGGEPVNTPDDLTRIISTKKPGDQVALEIFRNGSTQTVTVTLGQRPAQTS